MNDGEAAGQAAGHAHIQVIPRYAGDVEASTGGKVWVSGKELVRLPADWEAVPRVPSDIQVIDVRRSVQVGIDLG